MPVSFASPSNADGAFRLVTITEVAISDFRAVGRESGNGPAYEINLTTGVGNVLSHPRIGDAWIISKIGGLWSLVRRTITQNPARLDLTGTPQGSTVIGDSKSATYLPGDVIGDGLGPVGTITLWSGFLADAPTGWLHCDGAAISRTTYARLFAVVATVYGSGNGTTTFNVPNLKGRVVVGYNSADSDFNSIGETGGAKTVTHNHELSDNGYAKVTFTAGNPQHRMNRITVPQWTENVSFTGTAAASTSNNNTTGASLDGATDSTEASIVQPYMALPYIIRY